MPSQAKIEMVAKVKEQMAKAKSIVIADFRGMSVGEMTDLRVKLHDQGAELHVIKNRLARIALQQAGLPAPGEHLCGPSAFALSFKDPVAGPKALCAYAKANEKLTIKCGLFEGSVMDKAGVATLANLPGREVLLGRLVGDLKGPMAKLAMVVKATVNQLANVLQAMAKRKEAET